MVKYRAVITDKDFDGYKLPTVWFNDIHEANEAGNEGLKLYGGTSFYIEDEEEARTEVAVAPTYAGTSIVKPPIGIMPKYIWEAHRLQDLEEAIKRYLSSTYPLPPEWITERNELRRLI